MVVASTTQATDSDSSVFNSQRIVGGFSLPELVVLATALVAGFVLRWNVLDSSLGYVDWDEATAGILARDFFHDPSAFFPQQAYGGTAEIIIVAVLAQLGADGALALKLVPLALHLAAAVICWRITIRVIPHRLGQLAVPVIMWCWPAYAVWASTKERGFYGAAIVLAAALVLLVLHADDDPSPRRVAILGLAVGFAVWTTPLLMFVIVPSLAWLSVRQYAAWRRLPFAALGAAVGAAPWIVWNLFNEWESLEQPSALGVSVATRADLAAHRMPGLFGFETPFDPDRDLVPGAFVLTVIVVLALLAVATWRTRQRAPALLDIVPRLLRPLSVRQSDCVGAP